MMNRYVVEFLGTLFLVFVIFATGNYLAIGAALAVCVMIGGAISGGVKNTSKSVINAAESGLTNVTSFFGNAATSIKNYFSNTSSTNYVGGKRRRRRR